MYESPIEMFVTEIQNAYEDGVMKVVQNRGFNVNKEELIKALQYDRGQYEKGRADGYMQRDAEIVRCTDCKWYEIDELRKDGEVDRRYKPSVCYLYQQYQEETYFCADAIRKEGDAK